MNVYEEHGYRGRAHYLECLARDYGLFLSEVQSVADALGPEEDFEGLPKALEDMYWEDFE